MGQSEQDAKTIRSGAYRSPFVHGSRCDARSSARLLLSRNFSIEEVSIRVIDLDAEHCSSGLLIKQQRCTSFTDRFGIVLRDINLQK